MSSLTKQELVDVSALHIRDATGELMYAESEDGQPDESKPQLIHLYGPGTKQFAKAQQARNNKISARVQRKGKYDATADEARMERAEFLVGVTKSFENIDSDHGNTGDELFLEVYANQKLVHIAEQAEIHAKETANFKPPSSKS